MNKIKTLIICVALTLGINVSAQAKVTVGGYPACISENYFNQLLDAINDKDDYAINFLVSNTLCIVTKPDIPVTVLSNSWGISKVRAYISNKSIILWTNSENIID
jgi:hypothetical protein